MKQFISYMHIHMCTYALAHTSFIGSFPLEDPENPGADLFRAMDGHAKNWTPGRIYSSYRMEWKALQLHYQFLNVGNEILCKTAVKVRCSLMPKSDRKVWLCLHCNGNHWIVSCFLLFCFYTQQRKEKIYFVVIWFDIWSCWRVIQTGDRKTY